MHTYRMDFNEFNKKLSDFDPNKELQKNGILNLFNKKVKIKIVNPNEKPPSFIQKIINFVTFKSSGYSKTFRFDQKALLNKLNASSSDSQNLAAIFMEKVCGEVKPSPKWDVIVQKHQPPLRRRQSEINGWIETIITGLKRHKETSCHYDKVYCFFQSGDQSDIIFGHDGQWDPNLALNLTPEEKSKILILLVPRDKNTEKKFLGEVYLNAFLHANGMHAGMDAKVFSLKDFHEIQRGKLPKSFSEAFQS
ncbi:putative uncharacterized protein [Parachlamydia acanthamoebae UV-7]|uniref:Uncharacterized protein n=2 Tax=Parachlamydia acanthamoebae TaxID=83552 RepID=F8KWH8_PARAV|nr:hypothetical protein [Parachlamydia acanthamoebae]KIA76153.1 hypothetical protein DB43_AS00230 [Parachlamydia acanthamoebae]CCB85376.1 putative uncharacterized protein [Parachlamydia acanthamoebae UV-7]